MLGQVGVNGCDRSPWMSATSSQHLRLNCSHWIVFQPIFPGDSGVDQLVEIIKVLLLSSNQFFTKSRSKVLGTPTREQIKEMNPNYTEFKFPQIKAHPWPKVSFGQFWGLVSMSVLKVFRARTSPEAIDLVSRLLEYTPSARITPLQVATSSNFWHYCHLLNVLNGHDWRRRKWKTEILPGVCAHILWRTARAGHQAAQWARAPCSLQLHWAGELEIESSWIQDSWNCFFFRNWKSSLLSIPNLCQLIYRWINKSSSMYPSLHHPHPTPE